MFWLRYSFRFWRWVWRQIYDFFFTPWSWIETFLLLILMLLLLRIVNQHGGFFKVHRAESVCAPVKVHKFATRPPSPLEKFLRLTAAVNVPETRQDISAKKKEAPNFGA